MALTFPFQPLIYSTIAFHPEHLKKKLVSE